MIVSPILLEGKAGQVVEEIFQLYKNYGRQEYGERVSMFMHMMPGRAACGSRRPQ